MGDRPRGNSLGVLLGAYFNLKIMSKTYKHQATYDYLHGNKNVGKYLRGILRYFNRCNWPKWDGARMSWYKHKLFKQGKL